MRCAHLLALAALFAAELALFHLMTDRHHAWVYPRWFDQVQYLTEAYQGYELSREQGFMAGVWHTFTNQTPQGIWQDFWALLAFTVAGPSRIVALDLNLLAFLALQGATFLALRRLTGGHAAAWMAVGLLAALHGPWSGGSGSAVDFRLDWMAVCAYGVALAAATATDGFRSTRWSVLFGAAVGAVLLTRTLTAVYFAAIFPALLGVLLTRPDRWPRTGRLVLAGLVALALAGPAFWHNRETILNYYWVGHVDGPERALRDLHLGGFAAVRWIVSVAFSEHLGSLPLLLGLGSAVLLLAFRAQAKPGADSPGGGRPSLRFAWVLSAVFLAAPVAVLLLHTLKASQPVGIVSAPVVWLLVLGCLGCARAARPRALAGLGGAVVAAGGLAFAMAVARAPHSGTQVQEARTVSALVDYLVYRSEETALANPRVAVAWVSDALGAQPFALLGYERHGRWMHFAAMLPTGLFETTEETVRTNLGRSDFVCLVTKAPAGTWPFDRQMLALRPSLVSWCDSNLKRLGELKLQGLDVAVYERRGLGPEGREPAAPFPADPAREAALALSAVARPPAPPFFPKPLTTYWSAGTALNHRLFAAYGPVSYRATGLPGGLSLDEKTGLIRGPAPREGTYRATVTALNAVGSVTGEWVLRVDPRPSFAVLANPGPVKAGQTFDLRFDAFDSLGLLNYLDVTDLTASRTLGRFEGGESAKQNWSGKYALRLDEPGPHTLLLRFVRYDAAAVPPYTFFDESLVVEVVP